MSNNTLLQDMYADNATETAAPSPTHVNIVDPTKYGQKDDGGIRRASGTQKIIGFIGRHLDKIQDRTVGEVMETVSAKSARVSAEATAAARGLTNIAIGTMGGLLEGITGGTLAGFSGTDKLALARLETMEFSPRLVGYVKGRQRKMGIDYLTLALEFDLDGTPLPLNTETVPLSAAVGAEHKVNFDGDRFKAFFLPIKAGQGRTAKTVGFYAIDDRDRDHDAIWPVYQIMTADIKAAMGAK